MSKIWSFLRNPYPTCHETIASRAPRGTELAWWPVRKVEGQLELTAVSVYIRAALFLDSIPFWIVEAHEIIPRVCSHDASHLRRVVLRHQRACPMLVPAAPTVLRVARVPVQVVRTARRVAAP